MSARNTGQLFVVAAPSGAGKTSLLRELSKKEPGLKFSISYTTRPKREQEQDGIDYRFVVESTFKAMASEGRFLEHARVFDHYYATGRDDVEALLDDGRDVILEIDWQGAQQVRTAMPASRSIFILPPTRQALESRLRGRSTDSDEAIRRRLADSVADMSHWDEFDYVIVNDDFATAVDQLREIITGGGEPYLGSRTGLNKLTGHLLDC